MIVRPRHAAILAALLVTAAVFIAVSAQMVYAGGNIAFVDAHHGWRTTLQGKRAIIWRTVSGGSTWTRLQSTLAGSAGGGPAPSPGNLAFASPAVGIWYWFAPLGKAAGFQRTTNGGQSWRKGGSVGSTGLLNDVSFADRRVAWACSTYGSGPDGGFISRSGDAGASWRVRMSLHPSGYFSQVSCPTSRTCYALGWDARGMAVWATSDGGAHWSRGLLPGEPDWTAIDFPGALTGWAVGFEGRIVATTNGGETWTRQPSDSSASLRAVSFVDSLRGWTVGEYGTVLRTTDGGSNWETLYSGTSATLYEVTFVDRTHGWAQGWDENGDVLLRTTDGGDTWTELP